VDEGIQRLLTRRRLEARISKIETTSNFKGMEGMDGERKREGRHKQRLSVGVPRTVETRIRRVRRAATSSALERSGPKEVMPME